MKQYKISGSLEDKVYVVTGANSGIGRETTKALFAAGATVYMACRSEQKAQEAKDHILNELNDKLDDKKLIFIQLDLFDFKSVRKAAEKIKSCNVLINNAGFAGQADEVDGIEPIFYVNHLSHFLFTLLLLPVLNETAEKCGEYSRIVNVSSRAHLSPSALNIEKDFKGQTKSVISSYALSKLANVLFTVQLAKKLKEKHFKIYTYSLHPGVVATDVWRSLPWLFQWFIKLFMLSEEDGALTTLYCATCSDVANEEFSGEYFDDCTVAPMNPLAKDEKLCEELWMKSIEWAKMGDNEVTI